MSEFKIYKNDIMEMCAACCTLQALSAKYGDMLRLDKLDGIYEKIIHYAFIQGEITGDELKNVQNQINKSILGE